MAQPGAQPVKKSEKRKQLCLNPCGVSMCHILINLLFESLIHKLDFISFFPVLSNSCSLEIATIATISSVGSNYEEVSNSHVC